MEWKLLIHFNDKSDGISQINQMSKWNVFCNLNEGRIFQLDGVVAVAMVFGPRTKYAGKHDRMGCWFYTSAIAGCVWTEA